MQGNRDQWEIENSELLRVTLLLLSSQILTTTSLTFSPPFLVLCHSSSYRLQSNQELQFELLSSRPTQVPHMLRVASKSHIHLLFALVANSSLLFPSLPLHLLLLYLPLIWVSEQISSPLIRQYWLQHLQHSEVTLSQTAGWKSSSASSRPEGLLSYSFSSLHPLFTLEYNTKKDQTWTLGCPQRPQNT